MSSHTMTACQLTGGAAQGRLLYSDTPLSFWGGVHPATGEVIDRHHPLSGQVIAGQVLAIPSGRGSCTGSSVLMEIILNGHGPAALVLEQPDEILALGAIVAELVFGQQLPVVSVGAEGFAQLRDARWVSLQAKGQLTASSDTADALAPGVASSKTAPATLQVSSRAPDGLQLTPADQAILDGAQGKARQVALQIVLRMARLQGATELIDVVQAHIDGCIYRVGQPAFCQPVARLGRQGQDTDHTQRDFGRPAALACAGRRPGLWRTRQRPGTSLCRHGCPGQFYLRALSA